MIVEKGLMGIILLAYLPALIGMFIIGLFVILRQRRPMYYMFALTLFIVTLWLTMQLVSLLVPIEWSLWTTRVSLLAFNFIAPSFFIFTLLYPVARRGLKRKTIISVYLPACVIAPLSFMPELVSGVERQGFDLILRTGFLYDAQSILAVIYIVSALATLGWRYKHETQKDRVAIMMLFIAFLFPLIVGVLANYLWINIPGTQYLMPVTLFVTFLIIAYAIVKHKLFDLRLAVARTLGYVLLLVTLFGIYTSAIFVVAQLLFADDIDGTSIGQTTLYFVFAVFLAITYNPLKAFFDRVTDSIFYRQDYTSQSVLTKFSNVIANEIDLKHLSDDVIKTLFTTIKPEFIRLHVGPQRDQPVFEASLGSAPRMFNKDIMKKIDEYPDKVIMVDYMDEAHESLQERLNKLNVGVIIRLETVHDKIGYLIFGQKLNGSIYSSKEMPLFRSIGNELALALQNSLRFEEIQNFTKTLQVRIESATHRLRTTNQKLRDLDVAKDEFVSMASHQLRTPLTSVKGYISMVLEGDAGKITPMQSKLLSEAFTSSERMVHLIGDFLNVSRLQTGKFVLEQHEIDLSKVVKQEVGSLETTAGAHGLKLAFHAPSYFPMLYIDEGKIRQVVMNFIDNAIYYSEEGTSIDVKLSIESGYAVLKVHDTGIGVPKAEQAHLFTKFFRATNARKQRPDGTGVGLFLAKKVIVAHGGTMLFESVEGEGSTFGFRLPIKKLSTVPDDSANQLKD